MTLTDLERRVDELERWRASCWNSEPGQPAPPQPREQVRTCREGHPEVAFHHLLPSCPVCNYRRRVDELTQAGGDGVPVPWDALLRITDALVEYNPNSVSIWNDIDEARAWLASRGRG